MKISWIATVAMALGSTLSLHCQEPGMRMVSEADSPYMRGALLRVQGGLSKMAEMHLATVPDSLRANVAYMVEVFPRPNVVPAHYVEVFKQSADLLESVTTKKRENAQMVVNDLDEDFSVIVNDSKPNQTGTIRPEPFTVMVQKGPAEVKGWEIFYMEYFLRNVRKEIGPDSFPLLSTSSTPLVPGRYLFQARGPNGTVTERKSCVVSWLNRQSGCVLLVP